MKVVSTFGPFIDKSALLFNGEVNIRSFICVFENFKKNATLNAVVQGLSIMTALPAYPVGKVG